MGEGIDGSMSHERSSKWYMNFHQFFAFFRRKLVQILNSIFNCGKNEHLRRRETAVQVKFRPGCERR